MEHLTPVEAIAEHLLLISDCYRLLDEPHRQRAFKKVADAISDKFKSSYTVDEIKAWSFPGFGKSTRTVVCQFAVRGCSDRLDQLMQTPCIKARFALTEVSGIGSKKAEDLISMGITSVSELQDAVAAKFVTISRPAAACLEHHADLLKRIPFQEMLVLERELSLVFREVELQLNVVFAGSFRRHKGLSARLRDESSSGDIDVFVTDPDVRTREDVDESSHMKTIVKFLKRSKLFVASLSVGPSKYAGLIALPRGCVRRLDMRLFPHLSKTTGLLHYTGSATTNASMRLRAAEQGMKLSEYALVDSDGVEHVCDTEEYIFECLGTPFIEPQDR